MKIFFKKNYAIFIFIILALTPFLWFSKDLIILGPDSLWSLNYNKELYRSLFLWKESTGLGYGWSDVGAIPHNYLAFTLLSIGLSYGLMQKVIIGLLIFINQYFFYLLILELIPKDESGWKRNLLAIFGSIFYVTNFFALTWVWWRFLWVIYIYPVWPLSFFILIQLLKGKITLKKGIFYGIILSLFSPGIAALVMSFSLGLSLFVFSIIYFVLNRKVFLHLRQLSLFIIFLILLNSWWLLPGILMINRYISNALTAYDPAEVFRYTSQTSQLSNAFSLTGYRPIHDHIYGESYYGTGITTGWKSLIILFIPIIVITFNLFFYNNKTKNKIKEGNKFPIGFLILLLLGLFLIKGANPPFQLINYYLLDVPLGAAFRIPYDKFGYWVSFSLSILLPLTIYYNQKRKLIFYTSLSGFIVFLIFSLSIFIPGSFLRKNGDYLSGIFAKIPLEYKQLENYSFETNQNILVLPPSNSQESSFKWEEGVQPNGKDIISAYVKSPVTFLPNGNIYSDYMRDYINRQLFSGFYDYKELNKYLANSGIKYIFLHKDWNEAFMSAKVSSPLFYQKIIESNNNFKKIEENNYFIIYQVSAPFDLPLFKYTNEPYFTSVENVEIMPLLSYILNRHVTVYQKQQNNGDPEVQQISSLKNAKIFNNGVSFSFYNSSTQNAKLYIDESFLKNFEDLQIVKLDDLPLKGISYNSNLITGVELNLEKGNHTLTIKDLAERKNSYIENSNFEDESLWSQDWECLPKNRKNIKRLSRLSNNYYVNLIPKKIGTTCMMTNINNLSNKMNTIISFEYIAKLNNARIAILADSLIEKKTEFIFNKRLDPVDQWTTETLSFQTQPNKRYRLLLYADGGSSDVSFDDFTVRQVPTGLAQFALMMYKPELADKPDESQSINKFTKINPTLYRIETPVIENKILFSYNASFDSGWHLYVQKRDTSFSLLNLLVGHNYYQIPNNQHVLVNSAINGWLIDPKKLPTDYQNNDNYEFILEYSPQRWFYLGLLISGITLISCVCYFGYDLREKRYLVRKKKTTISQKNHVSA